MKSVSTVVVAPARNLKGSVEIAARRQVHFPPLRHAGRRRCLNNAAPRFLTGADCASTLGRRAGAGSRVGAAGRRHRHRWAWQRALQYIFIGSGLAGAPGRLIPMLSGILRPGVRERTIRRRVAFARPMFRIIAPLQAMVRRSPRKRAPVLPAHRGWPVPHGN